MKTKTVLIEFRSRFADCMCYEDVESVEFTDTSVFISRPDDVRVLNLKDIKKVIVTTKVTEIYEF